MLQNLEGPGGPAVRNGGAFLASESWKITSGGELTCFGGLFVRNRHEALIQARLTSSAKVGTKLQRCG